jgi:hypothetical protein
MNEFLIKEYEQIWIEIRDINNSHKWYLNRFQLLLLVLFSYLGWGLSHPSKIEPLNVYVTYSLIGYVGTFVILFFGLFLLSQYSTSKRHKYRYWKRIHEIRQKISTEELKEGNLDEQLMNISVPKTLEEIIEECPNRPNASGIEFLVPYLMMLVNLIVVIPLFYLTWILLSKGGTVNQPKMFFETFVAVMPFVNVIMCIYPSSCLNLRRNILSGYFINRNDPYFRFPKDGYSIFSDRKLLSNIQIMFVGSAAYFLYVYYFNIIAMNSIILFLTSVLMVLIVAHCYYRVVCMISRNILATLEVFKMRYLKLVSSKDEMGKNGKIRERKGLNIKENALMELPMFKAEKSYKSKLIDGFSLVKKATKNSCLIAILFLSINFLADLLINLVSNFSTVTEFHKVFWSSLLVVLDEHFSGSIQLNVFLNISFLGVIAAYLKFKGGLSKKTFISMIFLTCTASILYFCGIAIDCSIEAAAILFFMLISWIQHVENLHIFGRFSRNSTPDKQFIAELNEMFSYSPEFKMYMARKQ